MAWFAWITLSGSTRSLTASRRAQVSVSNDSDAVDLLLGEVEVVAGAAATARARPCTRSMWRLLERAHLGVEREAAGEQHELGVDARDRAVAGRRAAQRAAELAQLDDVQRRAGARAGARSSASMASAGSVSTSAVVADVGHRLLGVLVQAHERRRGDHRERVDLGRERAQRLDHGRVALDGAVDHHDAAAAQRRGDLLQRRELHDPERGRDVVGGVDGPLRPGRQHALGLAPVPQHEAGVDLAQRVEPELERGDDAEVAAAAAQRPEQLGVVAARRCAPARRRP